MKKKPVAELIISPEIMAIANRSVGNDEADRAQRCAVCGAATVPLTGPPAAEQEDLCWVCRRLKISAWRESEGSVSLQE